MKYILLFFAVVLFACGSNNDQSVLQDQISSFDLHEEPLAMTRQMPAQATPAPPSNSEALSSQSQEINKKKIIKDGNVNIKVKNLESAKTDIDRLVAKYNAYYSNESLLNNDFELNYNLTIRIPSQYFESFIDSLENGKGEILYKNITARDVTEEFIDLETRLINKRSYLQQYRDILKRARTIKDILEVQEKIRRIEEEIESTEGRLKYLSDQVSFSTIHLTLLQKKEYIYTPQEKEKFIERLKQNLSKGWDGFIGFLLFVIKLWPFWLICYGTWFLFKRWRKKRKNKLLNK